LRSALSAILRDVEPAAWASLQALARQHAPCTGSAAGKAWDNQRVHELADRALQLRGTMLRLGTLCALYQALPDYAVQMRIRWLRKELSPAGWRALWRRYRRWLRASQALASPAQYCLHCDWFEDRATVARAWRAMSRGALEPAYAARLLQVSGPVPWALKSPLFGRLVRKRAHHGALLQALVFAQHDVYGDFDVREARALYGRLRPAAGAAHRATLEQRLAWPALPGGNGE